MKDATIKKKQRVKTPNVGVYPDTLERFRKAKEITGLPLFKIADIAIRDFLNNRAEQMQAATATA